MTENDKLAKWFSELRVDELREGGVIKFDLQDGTFEDLEIIELKPYSVLEYTWDEDRVRFELYPDADGCRLVLIEKINKALHSRTSFTTDLPRTVSQVGKVILFKNVHEYEKTT